MNPMNFIGETTTADVAPKWYIRHGAKDRDTSFILNVERQKVKINLANILYVEAMDNYVKIFRDGLSTVVTLMSMKDFVELLPADRFMRVHRSYIVPIHKVESIGSRGIYITGVHTIIPIGRTYMKDCQERLK